MTTAPTPTRETTRRRLRLPGKAPSRPTRPSRGRHHRADIQGLRALAVIAVVAYHSGLPLSGGFVGVDVFFVISGFVIVGVLHRELLASGRISLSGFYRRRIRRILPAAALLLLVGTAMSALLLSPLGPGQQSAGQAAAASSVFLANGYFFFATGGYFEPVATSNPFMHMWSLSVEEQFYLVFPVTLLAIWWAARRWGTRALLIGLGLVAVASFALCLAFTFDAFAGSSSGLLKAAAPTPEKSLSFAFYSPFTRAWEFLAGGLLAITLTRFRPGARLALASAWVGAAAVIAALVLLTAEQAFPGYLALLPVLGTVALLLGGSGTAAPSPTRALSVRPMTWLGDRSYSWYLWHWPIIVFALIWWPAAPSWAVGTVAAALSLLPAIAAYRWVENPIHRGRVLPSGRATLGILITAVIIPLLAGLALVAAWQNNWGREDLRAMQQAVVPKHIDQVNGCAATNVTLATHAPTCTFSTPGATGTVLLAGDSNAGHFTEGVIAAAHRLDMNLEVVTGSSCPMIVLPSYPYEGCAQWTTDNLNLIAERGEPYTAVILGAAPSYPYGYSALLGGPGQPPPVDTNDALGRWGQAVNRTAEQISRTSPVIVVDPAPQLAATQGLIPQCLVPSILTGEPRTECATASAAQVASRDAVAAALNEATGPDITHFDAAQLQCTAERECSAVHNGTLMYRDGSHLSIPGALAYTDLWEKTLRQVTRN